MDDFGMVIINDGGEKESVERLVNECENTLRNRIHVIHNDRPMGMQAAANHGIRTTSSKDDVVHDDDDSWHPDFLRLASDHLDGTGAAGVIVPTDLVIEEIVGDEIRTRESRPMFPDLRFVNLFKMCFENLAAPISFLYQSQVFDHIGYYDESLGGFGDWDFALRFLIHADIEYLDYPYSLAFYHQRPDADDINKNSVFRDSQEYLANAMTNKYMREDVRRGSLGLGYLLNSLRKDQHDHVQLLQLQRDDLAAHSEYLLKSIRGDLAAQTEYLERALLRARQMTEFSTRSAERNEPTRTSGLQFQVDRLTARLHKFIEKG